jgi:hypothetical protein
MRTFQLSLDSNRWPCPCSPRTRPAAPYISNATAISAPYISNTIGLFQHQMHKHLKLYWTISEPYISNTNARTGQKLPNKLYKFDYISAPYFIHVILKKQPSEQAQQNLPHHLEHTS